MTGLDLTVVREPGRLNSSNVADATEDGTAALAQALSALTGRDVPLFDGFVRDAPSNGLLLIRPTADFELIHSEMSPAAAASLPARSVMLAGRRDEMTAMLERFSIVAGVDDHRFFLWLSSDGPDRGRGFFGLKAVAAALPSATFPRGPHLDSERYGYIVGDRSHGLPGELVAYLQAYTRLGAPSAR